jgi:polyhydroxyalkanoate synthase subunit PhaE
VSTGAADDGIKLWVKPMTEDTTSSADALADTIAQWSENWKKMADFSVGVGGAWSNSMLPFIMKRAAEKRSGIGDELGDAIERMAQGPKLADVWDIDRKLMNAFVAWTKMRQKLAAYNANAARPWMRALERYRETAAESEEPAASRNWRDDFSAWSAVANQEMIHNQRSEDYLRVQRELLQAGIEFRKSQNELNQTMSTLLGIPTQQDFDELTRQLTELRREVRALSRGMPASSAPAETTSREAAPAKGGTDE